MNEKMTEIEGRLIKYIERKTTMQQKQLTRWYEQEELIQDIKKTKIVVRMILMDKTDNSNNTIKVGMEDKEFIIHNTDPSIQKVLEELKDRGVQNIINEESIIESLGG